MTHTLICPICKETFTTARINGKSPKKTCSRTCSVQHKNLINKAKSRELTVKSKPIGALCRCKNPSCEQKFTKANASHLFCCDTCRQEYNELEHPKEVHNTQKKKPKPLSDILSLMNRMGYGNKYGLFCKEHPELL